MKKVYLVGWEYDDFSEGGFDIMFASESKEKAIKALNDFKKQRPYDDFGKVPYGLRVLKLNEKDFEKVIERLDI